MPQNADTRDITPGTTLNGVIRAFDPTNWLSDVQLSGSFPTFLTGIAVNRGLDATAIAVGQRCLVVFNDLQNPQDAVLVAVYD